jgi:hypothetical protein
VHMLNKMSYEVGSPEIIKGGFRSFRVSNLGIKIGMLHWPTNLVFQNTILSVRFAFLFYEEFVVYY